MLDYSEVDMEVSDDSVETAEFSECRKVPRVDKIFNNILAASDIKVQIYIFTRRKYYRHSNNFRNSVV